MEPEHDIHLEIPALRHPESAKWTYFDAEVLPLWVADMDFAIAPSIRAALLERAQRSVGYPMFDDAELTGMLRGKFQGAGFGVIPERGLAFLSGVVQGLYAGVAALTSPGDDVLTMTPIYPPFLSAITAQHRNVRCAPLKETSAGWAIDFDAMEAVVTPATRLLMLCHPHNPTGRIWSREELGQLADFVQRHGLWVVSDELHADLTLEGEFIPFVAAASEEVRHRTVTLTGPCKTYNTAGLGIGAMISHDPQLIGRLKTPIQGIGGHPNTMSFTMWRAALRDDGRWLAKVLETLRENREILRRFLSERLPAVKFWPPQATYLAWLDFRAHPRAGEIRKYLFEHAKVALVAGPDFGQGNEGFARLNFATSRAILTDAMERIATASR